MKDFKIGLALGLAVVSSAAMAQSVIVEGKTVVFDAPPKW